MPYLCFLMPNSFVDALNRVAPVLTSILLLTNVYRHLFLDTADPHKCSALLTHGAWLDPPGRQFENTKPFTHWQPPGCILHEYSTRDIAACNGPGKILFVGDSGTRQVFWAAARKIEGNSKWVFEEREKLDLKRGDIEFERGGAHLKFLWDPWLNSSKLYEELSAFRIHQDSETTEEKHDTGKRSAVEFGSRRPVVILIGAGLWHARHLGIGASLVQFKAAIENITTAAYSGRGSVNLKSKSSISSCEDIGDQIFFAPVLEPLYDRLSPSRELTITPSKINSMNTYLENQSRQGLSVLWSYANMTRGHPDTYGESGLHVIDRVAKNMADVLLNLRCNAKATQEAGYPINRTCCSPYMPTTRIQAVGIVTTAVLMLLLSASKTIRGMPTTPVDDMCFDQSKGRQTTFATRGAPFAGAMFFLAICYCFLADRTQILDKFPKHFSNFDFRILIGLIVVGFLFTIRASPPTPHGLRSAVQETFLPRIQSDEFKGWLQVSILVYRYTGASDAPDFDRVFPVFSAFYLFLSGYGHTMCFLQTSNYSLQRVAAVLLRLNVLAVFLSFMMDRPYSSYYFAPLASFWFLVIYVTLRLGNYSNDLSLHFLSFKIFASALLVACFIHVKGVLDFSLYILKITCRADLDVDEWRSHFGMGEYVVYVGMVAAMIQIRNTAIINGNEALPSNCREGDARDFRLVRWLSICSAPFIILVFWMMTRRSPGKGDLDWWMPYISWSLIVSIVVFRNTHQFLRSHYCTLFSWLGRISLESDGQALLRIGLRRGDGTLLNDRWRDLVVLTPILLWMGWHLSTATKTLTAWIVDPVDNGVDREKARRSTFTESGRAPRGLDVQGDPELQKRHKDLKVRLLVIIVLVWLVNLVR
ncbi:Cas1p-domain-containing protein [Melanomma pulvis-pyrius CBS 109.77]|uniref:Cas1p-domain-containing protein n=1 Tax=Melanomma pulvis-pyrius CBS 109.77 TaxID=1314802 RepID=A0A6A6XFM5_9PLEO|nr:Cas1p-domain-containing protein [Melanomma pulvis-pyrius CBS 109.77]